MAQPRKEVEAVQRAWGRVVAVWSDAHRGIARFDPNSDPDADPITIPALIAFVIACGFSTWMALRWRYQPMQDLGHHAALAAVVSDYGRPGSLYTALYQPIDPFAANSLLYQVAGRLGRLFGVTNMIRACDAFYVAGTPIATLYALRVFGRSPWAAVMATPLVYNMIYVAGFANMTFAAPLVVLVIARFYRALIAPTPKRVAIAAVLFALLFLAHAHMFLWTGAICFVMAMAVLLAVPARSASWRDAGRGAMKVIGAAAGSVLLALLFFAHWYARTFGEHRTEGAITNATGTWANHFGAYFRTTRELLGSFADSFEIFVDPRDHEQLVWLAVLVGVAISLARLHRYKQPPILELACIATGLSYFFLPDGIQGHDVIAARQPAIALWFLPALVSPVPARDSRGARWIVIAAICALSGLMLRTWYENMAGFEREEAFGLAQVMNAAPPRMRLHYVKSDPTSKYFAWKPFWHVEKLYMSDKLGQAADTPGVLSTSAIRYRDGVEIHRVADHSDGWVRNMEIWKNFDLVLLRRWHPSEATLLEAKKHGDRIAKQGDWELWKSNEATAITP